MSLRIFLNNLPKFNPLTLKFNIVVQIVLEQCLVALTVLEQHLVVLKISGTTSCGPENFWNNILWSCSILEQHLVVLIRFGLGFWAGGL